MQPACVGARYREAEAVPPLFDALAAVNAACAPSVLQLAMINFAWRGPCLGEGLRFDLVCVGEPHGGRRDMPAQGGSFNVNLATDITV